MLHDRDGELVDSGEYEAEWRRRARRGESWPAAATI
jgi:hypothetical protein